MGLSVHELNVLPNNSDNARQFRIEWRKQNANKQTQLDRISDESNLFAFYFVCLGKNDVRRTV